MKVQFLLDENLSPDIVSAVLRHDHTVAILRVGQPGAPAFGTPDEEILLHCETA